MYTLCVYLFIMDIISCYQLRAMKTDQNFEDLWISLGYSIVACVFLTSLLTFIRIIILLVTILIVIIMYDYIFKKHPTSTDTGQPIVSDRTESGRFTRHSNYNKTPLRPVNRSKSSRRTKGKRVKSVRNEIEQCGDLRHEDKGSHRLLTKEFSTYIDGGNELLNVASHLVGSPSADEASTFDDLDKQELMKTASYAYDMTAKL